MNRKLKIYILSGAVLVLSGCGIKTKLNEEELKWMNVYNENDTLVFRSQRGELDTSIIIKKEIFYPDYNPGEQHGKYLPQWGVIWYTNKGLTHHPDGYQLITLHKKAPKHETFLSINYLYSDFLFKDIMSDSLKRYMRHGIYEFESGASRYDPTMPKKIFWHEKYGLVKYITFGGDTWERINLPNRK